MKVNSVQLIALDQLHTNPNNPKRPLGARYSRGLKESLSRFGFSGVFNVAPNLDGTYELLDGNSRSELLDDAGATEAPCVIHEDMREGAEDWQAKRTEFTLSFDANRKVFDEDAVTRQLKELASKGRDVKALAKLTGRDNLKALLAESAARTPAPTNGKAGMQAKLPAMKSLTLYGPTEDVDAILQLTKRMRGRITPVVKVRQVLEQAERFQDVTDEQFLLALLSAVSRIGAGGESDG